MGEQIDFSLGRTAELNDKVAPRIADGILKK